MKKSDRPLSPKKLAELRRKLDEPDELLSDDEVIQLLMETYEIDRTEAEGLFEKFASQVAPVVVQ